MGRGSIAELPMPTRFTRRQVAAVGASALGASVIAAPSGTRPDDGAAATREASRAFPAGFLWGTATAAYQIEGAVSEDGRGPSIWDTFTHTPGKIRNDDNGDVADDHYHRYRDDVQSMKALAATAYRFSISWPRIFPQGLGAPNPKGLDFYDRLLDSLVANGIAPFPTLYHWDLPQALQDRGGWERRDTAEAFADYAGYVAEKLSDRARHFFTLNECAVFVELGHGSGVFAPGLELPPDRLNQVRHHALLAHGYANRAGGEHQCLRARHRDARAYRSGRARHPRAQCALPDCDHGRPLPRVLPGGCRRGRSQGRRRGHERDRYPGRFRRHQRLSAGQLYQRV